MDDEEETCFGECRVCERDVEHDPGVDTAWPCCHCGGIVDFVGMAATASDGSALSADQRVDWTHDVAVQIFVNYLFRLTADARLDDDMWEVQFGIWHDILVACQVAGTPALEDMEDWLWDVPDDCEESVDWELIAEREPAIVEMAGHLVGVGIPESTLDAQLEVWQEAMEGGGEEAQNAHLHTEQAVLHRRSLICI